MFISQKRVVKSALVVRMGAQQNPVAAVAALAVKRMIWTSQISNLLWEVQNCTSHF